MAGTGTIQPLESPKSYLGTAMLILVAMYSDIFNFVHLHEFNILSIGIYIFKWYRHI